MKTSPRANGRDSHANGKAKPTPFPESLKIAGVIEGRQIWLAKTPGAEDRGYLITEAGNIDRPIAYVPEAMQLDRAYQEAMIIAEDPGLIGMR